MLGMTKKNSVVVTGLGIISSIGIGHQEFWRNLLLGKSGISKVDSFDVTNYSRDVGGQVRGFKPEIYINKKKLNKIGRTSQLAIAATKIALDDAKLIDDDIAKKKTAVFIGTTAGESNLIERFNDYRNSDKKSKFTHNYILTFPCNYISTNIAHEFKFIDYNVVFPTACSSGNTAIGYAFDLIQNGKIDLAIAGGADSFSRIVYSGFCRLHAVAKEKCQPFDKNRSGMIPGEGAGVIVMETYENAICRKAPIYSEIINYGLSCDAFHMTKPSSNGIRKSIEKAMTHPRIMGRKVGYICAHGTGTIENDRAECEAINNLFKNETKRIPISSVKSMIGHTMGASSSIESIVCCLAIKNGKIPPTINLEEQDPLCDIDCVPNVPRISNIDIALNNSQAFGGNNVCTVFGKVLDNND